MATTTDTNHDDLLKTARERFRQSMEAEQNNRESAQEDIRFAAGDDANKYQWDAAAIAARKDRPCLTINKQRKFRAQVIGKQRQNRASIKVRPVDSQSDPVTADIMEGLIRNIEYNSNADVAYDTAFAQAVDGGFGYFRIITDYVADDSFEQEIRIKRIKNQFTVYLDPTAQEFDRSDARYAFVTELMTKDDFTAAYPNADATDFEGPGTDNDYRLQWFDGDDIRVAEYIYKEPVTRTIYQLENGEVVDAAKLAGSVVESGGQKFVTLGQSYLRIVKERAAKSHKVMWCKLAGGDQILEGPKELAGRHIPIVPVLGEEQIIDGETILTGLIHYAKDPQRIYNYMRSADVEMTALAPKVPWLATEKQIGRHLAQWKTANSQPYPFLLYDIDPNAPQVMPRRSDPVTTQPGIAQNALICNDEMKDTVGLYDASLGNQGNETSGRAIMARKQEGDTGTFVYTDNLSRALIFAGKILVDLIPKIYDTDRIIRVRGVDGKEAFVPINHIASVNGQQVIVNDLTAGKYDVHVDAGPSYATQRLEFLDGMSSVMQYLPDQMKAIVAPKLIGNMDWHGAQDIAKEMEQLSQSQGPPPPPPVNASVAIDLASLRPDLQDQLIQRVLTDGNIKANFAEAKSPPTDINGNLPAMAQQGMPQQMQPGMEMMQPPGGMPPQQ